MQRNKNKNKTTSSRTHERKPRLCTKGNPILMKTFRLLPLAKKRRNISNMCDKYFSWFSFWAWETPDSIESEV